MRRLLYIATLVIAGELVFALPFHTTRFFRPTLLEVFGLSNTQLGDLFAVYGVTAMLSYFPGGALADHFSARRLMCAALVASGLGGLYMATVPAAAPMAALYGFWGITTIFLMWGALIRATREWGGESAQGAAFGILESGRGATAALVGAGAVWLFAAMMPASPEFASVAERRAAMQGVILVYTAATLAAAVLVWFVVPEPANVTSQRARPFRGVLEVAARPVIWAQAGIIVCAYSLFKATDNYALYAVQVLGMDEVAAARLSALGAYIRPVAALAAGVIADRFDATRSIGVTFALLVAVFAALGVLAPGSVGNSVLIANLFVSLFAVFALRGIYFALLEETRTPRRITGTAVGVISLVGFTPEIFMGSIAGRILDATPGVGGHQDLFLLLTAIATIGVAIVVWLLWLKRNKLSPQPVSLGAVRMGEELR